MLNDGVSIVFHHLDCICQELDDISYDVPNRMHFTISSNKRGITLTGENRERNFGYTFVQRMR